MNRAEMNQLLPNDVLYEIAMQMDTVQCIDVLVDSCNPFHKLVAKSNAFWVRLAKMLIISFDTEELERYILIPQGQLKYNIRQFAELILELQLPQGERYAEALLPQTHQYMHESTQFSNHLIDILFASIISPFRINGGTIEATIQMLPHKNNKRIKYHPYLNYILENRTPYVNLSASGRKKMSNPTKNFNICRSINNSLFYHRMSVKNTNPDDKGYDHVLTISGPIRYRLFVLRLYEMYKSEFRMNHT